MPFTSIHNPLLQDIRQAARHGHPTPAGLVVAEGPHLLREALRSLWTVEQVFYSAEAREAFPELFDKEAFPTVEVSARAFSSLASTKTTLGVLALLRPRSWAWEQVVTRESVAIVLDAVQDPGNVGTIARSAEAFGASGIILASGCARVSNGKVLRASAGSLFRLPFLDQVPAGEIVTHLCSENVPFYVLTADGEISLADFNLDIPSVLVVGNEGAGVSPAFLPSAARLSIPTAGVESLNAGVAASVALYEVARQRTRS